MTYGADISDLDDIDWSTLSPALQFIICKKSEGATFTDKTYDYRSKYLPTTKLVWGDYCYMRPDDSVQSQLDNYFNGRVANNLPPILDAEEDGITPEMVTEWLVGAQAKTGRKPILYSYPSFLTDNLQGQTFDAYLWIAAYQPEPPDSFDWTIWQNSERGQQNGQLSGGSLDMDCSNLTIEQLGAL